ncbi:MAG: hypothetical protein E7677_03245 [Ruminococcaceae bacterium]|nr:hypothetical protein [Oscillospiraceae bacterium]
MIVRFLRKLRNDYRHIICIAITLISAGMGFLFPNALPRLAETVRDLGLSIAYYFCEIIMPKRNPITATVTSMPQWRWAEDMWEPLKLFPWTWEEFKVLWAKYWPVFFSWDNFTGYIGKLGDVAQILSRFLLLFLPAVVLLVVLLHNYKNVHCTDRNKRSRYLKAYEKVLFKVVYPVIKWCKDFVCFCREHYTYYYVWFLLWALHFNLTSLFVAFLAYYFYFAAAWDIMSLYYQVLKLFIDLAPIVRFIPVVVWIAFGVWIYNYVCRSMAFQRLYYAEKCNRAFLSSRGVVTTVYGEMGIGKTQMVTSMALSAEIEQFDMMFEVMLEVDMMFPNFPFQRFRDVLKKRIDNREIVDLPTCRKFVRKCRRYFDYIASTYTTEEYAERIKRYKRVKNDYTFGYDFTHYATSYNDGLKIEHLYEALEDYACAYLVFTVKTTLLFSNYSIRVDSILTDIGNMPYRDTDFFSRDPRLQEAYSHHAHIIDIDMLRLGKKMIKGNPKARRVSYGVYVITEIDKEFKNMQQLKETKMKEDECNQKNDLHDACLMMIRHAAVVRNRVIIRIITDLQRPEAWGAGGRELGEVIYIAEKSDLQPALPLLSPYWLLNGPFRKIKGMWEDFYSELITNRSDHTLFIYLTKNLISLINNHYDKVNGTFGIQELSLEIQSGRMDGEVKKDKWRIITKKDRSRRYKTACLEAVFDSYEPNTMHIDDFIEYAGEVGTNEENQLQNSYFQNDIAKMKELNA